MKRDRNLTIEASSEIANLVIWHLGARANQQCKETWV